MNIIDNTSASKIQSNAKDNYTRQFEMPQRKSILRTLAILYLQYSLVVYRSVSMETIKSRLILEKCLSKETIVIFANFYYI